jgi:hypothetical protein
MPWVIERVSPEPDGDNKNFTISHEPAPNTELFFFPVTPLEKVGSQPQGMQYTRAGVNVTFGLAPAQSRWPWARYFYET